MSDVSHWPDHLPHYQFVQENGKDQVGRQVFKMAIRRGPIPAAWTTRFEADRAALELRFEHLDSWTKGMKVQWTLTPTRDGTRVEIVHTLHFRFRLLAWLVEPIIGHLFIRPIAKQTLQTFKSVLESMPRPE